MPFLLPTKGCQVLPPWLPITTYQTTNEPKKNHLSAAIAEVRLVILIRCALAAFLTQATSNAVRLRNINIMLVHPNTATTIIHNQ